MGQPARARKPGRKPARGTDRRTGPGKTGNKVTFFGECASKGGTGKAPPATAEPDRVPLPTARLRPRGRKPFKEPRRRI